MLVPLSSSLSVFSFQSYRAHRHLHSFPTRRSSDLEQQLRLDPLDDAIDAVARLEIGEDEGPAGPSSSPIDRKSTRLNSSHTVISYAVFCLKKKKNKAETNQSTKR